MGVIRLLFKKLEEKLFETGNVLSAQIVKDREIYDLLPMAEGTASRDDVLYAIQDLRQMNITAAPANLLWCGEPINGFDSLGINWIRVSPESFSSVVERIKLELLNSHTLQSIRFRIMENLLHGTGLGGIMNEMGEVLDTSIVIMDMTGKILANTQPFKIRDTLWQESVSRGYCPPFFIEHIRDVRQSHEGEEEPDPVYRYCADRRTYCLSHRIYLNSELCAYAFMIQESQEFHPLCGEVLLMVGDAMLEVMRTGPRSYSAGGHMYRNLLADIFNGISPTQIQARIQAGEMRFPVRMCIAAVQPRYFRGDNFVRDALTAKLSMLFPKTTLVSYHGAVVLLFALDKESLELPEETVQQLESLCRQEHLVCGISNPFKKVSSARHYYDQAARVIELAGILDEKGDVFRYREFSFYDLVAHEGAERKLGFYCHPALAILREYDSDNNTELYDLLKTYAATGFNQNQTATELYLHRNTLSYRKQKIISLTGLDLEDRETQFLLQCSFRIANYMEKTRR